MNPLNERTEQMPADNGLPSLGQELAAPLDAPVSNKPWNKQREASRRVAEFVNDISHEFRTPLSVILAQADLLLHNADNNLTPTQLHQLQVLQRNALRLQKLVDSQIDFSKIEEQALNAIFQPTDITSFTVNLCSTFRSLIESAGLGFKVKYPEIKEPVYVNREIWEKIVFTLISNAFKFTLKGRIEVILRENKNHVQLRVRDTGVGIRKEDQKKIFNRFIRITPVNSRSAEGSGSSLALIKELVYLHGGTIKVNSEEGKGSIFTVTIPKGKSHLPPAQVFESKELLTPSLAPVFLNYAAGWSADNNKRLNRLYKSGKKKTVLVVDDNADMRAYVRELLSEYVNVIAFENAKKTMEHIESGGMIDMVILDILLPDADGNDLLKTIKSNESINKVPVIMLSARSNEDCKILALQYGADDYIVKPFSGEAFVKRILTHLQKNIENMDSIS